MGHLCFLWTLRREKGCWTTSAECPKQFGVSMPTDATEIEVDFAFWCGGKISDLDLFYQLFNLTFDWGHQAATCFEHNLGMLKDKLAKRFFESLTDRPYNLQYMDGFDMMIHFRICGFILFHGLANEYETAHLSAIKSLGGTMKPFLPNRVVKVNN